MVTPSAAVGGAACLAVSGLAGNRCSEVPYRGDGGGSDVGGAVLETRGTFRLGIC